MTTDPHRRPGPLPPPLIHRGDFAVPTPGQPHGDTARPSPPPPPPPAPIPGAAMPVPPPWQPPPAAPATPGLDLQPHHLLWLLAGLSAGATLVSGLGWILIVGACGYGAWRLQTRHTPWPADFEDVLVGAKLTQRRTPATAPVAPNPQSHIPFRPLSVTDLITGSFTVVGRNWPTLIGVPLVILTGFVIYAALAMLVVVQVMMSATTSVLESVDYSDVSLGGFGAAVTVVLVVLLLISCVIALPADALLIALTVTATDQAIRGRRVRLTEVVTAARRRMFAVCRLTVGFYAIFVGAQLLCYLLAMALLFVSPTLAVLLMLVLSVAVFVVGVLFSLAPIVLMLENTGVADSFRRSVRLVKCAWGRIVGIHLLWTVGASVLLFVPVIPISFVFGALGSLVFYAVALAGLVAVTRALQVLVYADIRMRQENFAAELSADWARNTTAG